MRTYILFSHPVDKDKIYELMGTPDENIKEYIKDVVVDVYRINQKRFIVVKDGNHRVSAYLLMRAGMQTGINGDFASELLSMAKVRERETLTVKEFLYFKQLLAIQSYVISSDDLFLFSEDTLNKCIEKGLIPKTVSKEIIPFYYLYVFSDQTQGCGCYLNALLSITEDENGITCSFTKKESGTGINYYESNNFHLENTDCKGNRCDLFDGTVYHFSKEYKDGILILKPDTEEINGFFNPLLVVEADHRWLNLDVFDGKSSDTIYFAEKPVPYGLCIFLKHIP